MDKNGKFIAAIQQNEALIYKIASLYTNTIDDRNDLVQEIIYQLWKSFDSFLEHSSLNTWMYRVAMNVAIYHLKVSKRKLTTVSIKQSSFELQEVESGDFEERMQVLKRQLDLLNLLDKGIVMLYLENKSYEEIAQIVGISTSNVGTRISRIKEKFKKNTKHF